ncbi:MAG: 5-(carboxyamino)imidazole ribonucleotide mutase [Planctomycetes bacterium]|nr:5-(carboxyamino)imidazole ribonucleotide mutase [Planctomycetota bacterium]
MNASKPQGKPTGPARVCILMGSDSDLPVMRKCMEQLDKLGVAWDAVVASAHRTPDRVQRYVREKDAAGCLVFVAAAGGAAHLAGAVAAQTTRPVLGVPMAVPPFNGLDALFSTVQMPPGMPVGTLAAGEYGATNAGILAAQIVAVGDPDLAERIRDDRDAMRAKVVEKNTKMRQDLGLPSEFV